jgi:hypothetical protein
MKTVLPAWLGRTPSARARARALMISISGVLPFSALNYARHLFSEGSLYRPARRCEAPKASEKVYKGTVWDGASGTHPIGGGSIDIT